MSSLYTELHNSLCICISNRYAFSLYGNRAGSNLYFDDIQVYMVVVRSFAVFGGSHAPDVKIAETVEQN